MIESDKIIFHYTSLEGLLGIIESKSIWATNILYLNDASEMNYSIGLLREQIINFQSEIRNAFLSVLTSPFFETLIVIIEDGDFIPSGRHSYFVFSFSEEKDQLSQWRGYCPGGIGFSLGFKFSKLKECVQQQGYYISRCIYDEKEQGDQLREIIKSTSGLISLRKDAGDSKEKVFVDLIRKFIKLAPTFKHPKFKEEKEWRIIAGPQSKNDNKLIKYRPGQSMIVPYIEIFLPTDGEHLLIDQIIVGPTHEPELSKASVEMLLKSKKVKFDEVQFSTIPYRHW
jgi:hypothetical protein